jgi:hypothetical protein
MKFACNVFVAGDLAIDHTVFVYPQTKRETLQHAPSESSHMVRRRLDTAGGAATAARTVAQLTGGTTFLWGLLGYSPWGTFRSILDRSQALDDADAEIELRGAADETSAPMSTVTRLVELEENSGQDENYVSRSTRGSYKRISRFTDFGGVHVPEFKRSALQYHLKSVKDKLKQTSKLHAVLIDDLNFGAFRERLAKNISRFCDLNEIDLIIRARANSEKFRDVKARCLVMALDEWISEYESAKAVIVKKKLAATTPNPEACKELARKCVYRFPNIDSFVIAVGESWINHYILIERASNGGAQVEIYQVPGHIQTQGKRSEQVGVSDVFAGALTAAISEIKVTESIKEAVQYAANVANVYQESSWHRIPTASYIDNYIKGIEDNRRLKGAKDQFRHAEMIDQFHCGSSLMPKSGQIHLQEAKTVIGGIYSLDAHTREALQKLTSDLRGGWALKPEGGDAYHLILAAPGGSGKSLIANKLKEMAKEDGKIVFDCDEQKLIWDWRKPLKMLEVIKEFRKNSGRPQSEVLVVVDEAIKSVEGSYKKNLGDKATDLLNKASPERIRFLFIDTKFLEVTEKNYGEELGRRTTRHEIHGLPQRPADIILVAAQFIRNAIVSDRTLKVGAVNFDVSAAEAIVEHSLGKSLNFGTLKLACERLANGAILSGDAISITWDQIANTIGLRVKPCEDWALKSISIQFQVSQSQQ